MRCYICDAALSEDSIHWSSDHKSWDPCPTCLIAIAEAFEDPLDEDEITWLLEQEDQELPDDLQGDDDFP